MNNKYTIRINGKEVNLDKIKELSNEVQSLKYMRDDASIREVLEQKVKELLKVGFISENLKILYDVKTEKFVSIDGYFGVAYKDSDKAAMRYISANIGVCPKGALELVPKVVLEFNPHKGDVYTIDTIEVVNTFIPTEYLRQRGKATTLNSINWKKYPLIHTVFKNVFIEQDRIDYFVNWLSYCLQTLKPSGIAIVSKGIQGTGKGVIFNNIITRAFGENNVSDISNEFLKSRFNLDLEGKLFVLANEIKGDFRDGNDVYEKLKMYITEPILRLEEKNMKRKSVKNYMNMWFHSNNAIPLQIQPSDRRYVVFNTTERKLIDVVYEDLGYPNISFFIEDMENQEVDDFIYDIMSLKFDKEKATRVISTKEKEIISEASTPKIEIIVNKLKEKDFDYFREYIYDFYELNNSEKANELKDSLHKMLNIGTADDFINELGHEVHQGFILNSTLNSLYQIIIDIEATPNRISSRTKSLLPDGDRVSRNGKTYRFKYITYPIRDKASFNL